MYRWGIGKNRDSRRTPGYRIDDCWSAINNMTVDRAVAYTISTDGTDHHASLNRIYHRDEYADKKRREHNLILLSGKSKAEVKDGARSIVLLKLTTDRHEESRGPFATAELC